eukprot:Skav218372  [mRNA]  locus=scaffold2066:208788:211928:+ [translate_table: standard]
MVPHGQPMVALKAGEAIERERQLREQVLLAEEATRKAQFAHNEARRTGEDRGGRPFHDDFNRFEEVHLTKRLVESLAITERHGMAWCLVPGPMSPTPDTSRLGQVELVKGARVPA